MSSIRTAEPTLEAWGKDLPRFVFVSIDLARRFARRGPGHDFAVVFQRHNSSFAGGDGCHLELADSIQNLREGRFGKEEFA